MTRRPLILQLIHVNKGDREARAQDGGKGEIRNIHYFIRDKHDKSTKDCMLYTEI